MEPIDTFDATGQARIAQRLAALPRRVLPGADKRAAVAVPLCLHQGAPAVLFTKRSESVSTHKGQVSFPGGRMDAEDADEVACALREMREEIGIHDANVLGVFHDVKSLFGVTVTPVVVHLGELAGVDALTLSRFEIEEAFVLPLSRIVDPALLEMRPLGRYTRAPFFTGGPHPVWGLTAYVLHEVLREVLGYPLGEIG